MMKFLLLAALLVPACSNSPQTCETTDDCFDGEVCVANRCQSRDEVSNNDACLLPSEVCEDDEWEENDSSNGGLSSDQSTLVWESNSWCDGEEPVMHARSFRATHCSGDPDAFRFFFQANQCVSSPGLTIRITVSIDTECDVSDIEMKPYDFFRDPVRNDLCDGSHEDVRCTQMNGGRTRVFEFLEQNDPDNQTWDRKLIISSEADIEFEYTVDVELVF